MKKSAAQKSDPIAHKQLVDLGVSHDDIEKLHAFGLPPGTLIGWFTANLLPSLLKLLGGINTGGASGTPPAPPTH